jgi:hypothetical protein
MSGCSNKEWLKKVVCQGILHIERGFSEKCSTQPMKIWNFWILPCKKVSKSKMDFFKMWIPQ